MSGKITLLILLATIVAFGLPVFRNQATRAQGNLRYFADTGLVTTGHNQKLRVTAAAAAEDRMNVRFVRTDYGQEKCTGNVCRFVAASRTETGIINLAPGETAYLEGDPDHPVIAGRSRVVVEGNKPMLINLQVVDTVTGQVSCQSRDVDLYR